MKFWLVVVGLVFGLLLVGFVGGNIWWLNRYNLSFGDWLEIRTEWPKNISVANENLALLPLFQKGMHLVRLYNNKTVLVSTSGYMVWKFNDLILLRQVDGDDYSLIKVGKNTKVMFKEVIDLALQSGSTGYVDPERFNLPSEALGSILKGDLVTYTYPAKTDGENTLVVTKLNKE